MGEREGGDRDRKRERWEIEIERDRKRERREGGDRDGKRERDGVSEGGESTADHGCQMVFFIPKNPNFSILWRALG
jgi:hypothetical protein